MPASNISKRRIRPLPALIIDRIAAGEVVDAPYSVVKELVENALDAGARAVTVETAGGGMHSIVVSDDGRGMHFEDLPLSLHRHATSKIEELEDIQAVLSFGFRGEALASIASVSHLELHSTQAEAELGGRIESRGGELLAHEPSPPSPGTRVAVRDLFYAVPARRKFIRSERGENARIYRELLKIGFARPEIGIRLVRDGREILSLDRDHDLRTRIVSVYRSLKPERLIPVTAEAGGIRLSGFVADEHSYRSNREGQFSYVNGRCVELQYLPFLIKKAFGELLPAGSYPYAFLFLELDPSEVDVNVHPAKKEVRLRDQGTVNSLVLRAVSEALRPGEPVSFERYQPASVRARVEATGPAPNGESPLPLSGIGREEQPPEGSAPLRLFGRTPLSGAQTYELTERDGSPVHSGNSARADPESSPEAARRAVETNRAFVPVRHFGVVFGTYILAEGEDAFYIVDQHTAHERVNYERMRSRLEELQSARQGLLEPIAIECLPDELELVLAERERLLECGFAVEEFGAAGYLVREVPAYVEPGAETDAIQHVIQRLAEGETVVRVYDDLAAMKACKASIKKNDYVTGETISAILLQLAECENPSRCPHGRPTMMKLTQAELDRMFHRS